MSSYFDFSEMPMERQIAIGMMLPFIPVLIGETMFFYLIIVGGVDVVTAFSISLGFSAFGLMLWYMWRDNVRQEILEFEPLNAMLFWSKEKVTWENQMIRGRVELGNELLLRPVLHDADSIPIFDNPPTYQKEVIMWSKKEGKNIRKMMTLPFKPKKLQVGLNEVTMGNPELLENFLVGWRCAEVELHHASYAPNGIPYKKMQLIHNFPYQDDFYMCPDQFVVHQAQVLAGSSSVFSGTFLYWGERGEPIPVFLIGYSPAHAELTQMAIGTKPQLQSGVDPQHFTEGLLDIVNQYTSPKVDPPAEGETPTEGDPQPESTLEDDVYDYVQISLNERNSEIGKKLRMEIDEAITLGDTGQAMELAQLLRQRTMALQSQKDTQKDVNELALGQWNYWDENMNEIEDLEPLIDFSDPRIIALIVLATVVLTGIAYWLWFR